MSIYVCPVCDCHVTQPHACGGKISDLPHFNKRDDPVNHPSHYRAGDIYETINVLEAWLTPEELRGFLKGQIIRYHSRSLLKGAHVQDVEKAGWYQRRLEELLKKEKK